MMITKEEIEDQRAKGAAHKAGLIAVKTSMERNAIDRTGGFRLLDGQHGNVVAGERFDLSAADVIEYCEE
jgi:hypothetical protein